MTCKYCGEADCNVAGLSVEQTISIVRKCRDRAHDRALRAEAEVAKAAALVNARISSDDVRDIAEGLGDALEGLR